MRRIDDGEWPPGELIPTEADLALTFGCARATVNRALQALAKNGVLERRRKVGTRVAQHPRVQMVRHLLRREIEAAGRVYGYAMLDYQELSPPADVAQAMLLHTNDVLLRVRSQFLADHAPYCCEERWINHFAAPGLTRDVLQDISPCEWLLGHVPINRGSVAMGAELAGDSFVPEALGMTSADPVMLVERMDWRDNMPISLTRRYFPATHRLTAMI